MIYFDLLLDLPSDLCPLGAMTYVVHGVHGFVCPVSGFENRHGGGGLSRHSSRPSAKDLDLDLDLDVDLDLDLDLFRLLGSWPPAETSWREFFEAERGGVSCRW